MGTAYMVRHTIRRAKKRIACNLTNDAATTAARSVHTAGGLVPQHGSIS